MWLRLSDEELELVKNSLAIAHTATPSFVKGSVELLSRITQQVEEDARDAGYIEQARERYAHGSDDDIEVDDDATFSRSDDGTWVMMWGWIPHSEPEDEVEEDKDEEHGPDCPANDGFGCRCGES